MTHHLLEITSSYKLYSKEITYVDFTVAGSVKAIKGYWEYLNLFATFFGCYPKVSKSSYPIVKIQYLETANVVFGNTKINLTSERMRHLGAVIRNHPYKEKYVNELVTNLNNQLRLLSKIAKTKP